MTTDRDFVLVWDDDFRTPCCGATTTFSGAVLCCRSCYEEIVYDDGGVVLPS